MMQAHIHPYCCFRKGDWEEGGGGDKKGRVMWNIQSHSLTEQQQKKGQRRLGMGGGTVNKKGRGCRMWSLTCPGERWWQFLHPRSSWGGWRCWCRWSSRRPTVLCAHFPLPQSAPGARSIHSQYMICTFKQKSSESRPDKYAVQQYVQMRALYNFGWV